MISVKKKKKSFTASRLGCDYCKKQSRRKCDEQLPQCGGCVKKNIRCSYLDCSSEFLDRIKRAHSIMADHKKLVLKPAEFGKFKIARTPALARIKVPSPRANLATSQSPRARALANSTQINVRIRLNRYHVAANPPQFHHTDFSLDQSTLEIFDGAELLRKRIYNLRACFLPQIISACCSLVMFLAFQTLAISIIQRNDSLNPDAPEKRGHLTRLLNRHYSYSIQYINREFNNLLALSAKSTDRNSCPSTLRPLSDTVFEISTSSMLHFGASFYRSFNYRVAINCFYHYIESMHLFRNISKTFELKMTGPKQGGDGFGFYKELAYGDSKEVFIPSYDPTFLAEVLEDLMAFKKFVVHDGHMLRQYNDLIRFFGSLQNEILPLKNDNYVVKFPADVIFQVQNYWYRILPGECGILDNPKNMTAVQKVFYVYWVAIAISLSAVINSCGYISGTGLLGYANAHRPFQSNIFDDINDSKNPVDIELKSHAIYLVRLISFFTMRRNICFENIHFKQPYPDFLLQGNNRFKSRVLSCIEEDCVTNFKTHYFTPKNFPSLSYNSSFNQGKMPLFDHYQVLFKENNPPKNTRINSIIHNESLSTPIPFHAMKISENGLLERDFNPRLSSYLSTRDYGKNFDQDLYLERHLTELLQDRRLLHSVTLYDSNNNVDPTAYLAILNDIAKDDENGVNEFDAQVLADNIAAKNRDFLQLINYS